MKSAFIDLPNVMRTRSLLGKDQIFRPILTGTHYNTFFQHFPIQRFPGNSIRRLYHGTSSTANSSAKDTNSTRTSTTSSRTCAPRAARAVEFLPSYLADARQIQTYSPETPDGALQLSVAENQMLEDLLCPSLTEMSTTQTFPPDAIYYQPTHGRPNTRAAMANYLTDILELSHPMDPDGIVVGAGCNAVLENLCICLAEPGEGVMLPTPYYAAFQFDLGSRAGLNIVAVPTMDYQDFDESKGIPEHAYYPNRASLDAAFEQSIRDGVTPRILLLSHPMNPLGICYPPHVIQDMVDWCREKEIHLVTDEIYAGSVYRKDEANFVSTLEIASSYKGNDDDKTEFLGLGPYIHLVYSLSKDFALSGLRVGASYSENQDIRLPLQKLNDLCAISSQTQLLVERMLTKTVPSDNNNSKSLWTREFMSRNHERLRARGDKWHQCLDELNIPYLRGSAGLFVWMDLREFLPNTSGSDDERERTLYLELMKECGIQFTPGRSMMNERPGFFRCVFSAASDAEFELGMQRLRKYVHAKRA